MHEARVLKRTDGWDVDCREGETATDGDFRFLARADAGSPNLWVEALQRGREINPRSPEILNGIARNPKQIFKFLKWLVFSCELLDRRIHLIRRYAN